MKKRAASPGIVADSMNHEIDDEFRNIKSYNGGQRYAFEEMCFQLFTHEFGTRGEPVRREGRGGDAGLEGFVANPDDCALIGLQAKFFDRQFSTAQWRQIDESVQKALRTNATDGMLQEHIVATNRVFTKSQRAKWKEYRDEWRKVAGSLGYAKLPKFTHWDSSQLRTLLLKPVNRGRYLYWFGTPDFHSNRCKQLTENTIAGLSDRYIPSLHTRTSCETDIHRFLRTESARVEFCEETRAMMGRELVLGWVTCKNWSRTLKPLATKAKQKLDQVIRLLGNGCELPDSIGSVLDACEQFNKCFYAMLEAAREEAQKLNSNRQTPSNKQAGTSMSYGQLFGNSEGLHFGHRFRLADKQCLLVLGEAGKGKTHLLAEICTRLSDGGGTVLFVEGQQFGTGDSPWSQLLSWADFRGGVRDFLSCFSAMSETSALSGVVCIDALNETPNRDVWLHNLQAFASELKPYPNLKLIASCRSDYAELTIPDAIRSNSALDWDVVTHRGLGVNVFDAVPKYLKAYNVKGFASQLFVPEFETPLMLKTFCETFDGKSVPHGTFSLPSLLSKYVDRKASNILRKYECGKAAVWEALRQIADQMSLQGKPTLAESHTRQICRKLHNVDAENRSLYRALVSEGVLHEIVQHAPDGLGIECVVRFAFERIWDYFLSERLWPSKRRGISEPSADLLAKLKDTRWRRSHRGVLRMLAIRLPEAGHGELHDWLGIEPGTTESRQLDEAFTESIQWRTYDNCTERTREHLRAVNRSLDSQFNLLASLCMHDNNPWNADCFHERLLSRPLGERDRKWTMWLNSELVRTSDSSAVMRVIRFAEESTVDLLSDAQALLCGTALSWMLATTVPIRRRIAIALANLLKDRPSVAAELFERFEPVDDPYILELLLFACAAVAVHARPKCEALEALASIVHSSIFGVEEVNPNVAIRYYASIVCEQAAMKRSLPKRISCDSFRPPFRSTWPTIMSARKEDELESKVRENYHENRALRSVVDSSRTNGCGDYGDWGRYVLESAVGRFQNRRLAKRALREAAFKNEFDARIARRYVLQRVLELGLDPDSSDHTPGAEYAGRQGSHTERLGKKYQWIALAEFLGLLWDHYHRIDADEKSVNVSTQYDLPNDSLDPSITKWQKDKTDSSWKFIPTETPWWIGQANPVRKPLSPKRRNALATRNDIASPQELLKRNDGEVDWFILDASIRWNEPIPCFQSNGLISAYANFGWNWCSFIVPYNRFAEFASVIPGKSLDNEMCPEPFSHRVDLHRLSEYPANTEELSGSCEPSFANGTGAWFTACRYSNGLDDELKIDGIIPSPQLAKLLKLKWCGSTLDFIRGRSTRPVFRYEQHDEHVAAMIAAESLLPVLKSSKQRLVWRIYGWKRILADPEVKYGAREYWMAYVFSVDGTIECLGGGTRIIRHNALVEKLPWL